MRLIRLFLVFYIFLYFFLSCSKLVEPEFKNLEESLNIEADFNLIDGILIRVEKAIPINTKSILFENILVNDAKVYLKDSSTNTTWLIPYSDLLKKYYQPSIKPSENHIYKIEVILNNKIYNSLSIKNPITPSIEVIDKSIVKSMLDGFNGFKFNYIVKLNSSSTNQYFSTGAFNQPQHFERSFDFSEYIQQNDLCGYNNSILPNICFYNKTLNLNINGFILNNAGYDPDLLFKGKHYIYFSSVSPRYYNYLIASAEPNPIERFFTNPSIIPSDFPGAFGTFLIRNMVIIDSIEIK